MSKSARNALLLGAGAMGMAVLGAIVLWITSQFTISRVASATAAPAAAPVSPSMPVAQVVSVQPHMVTKSTPYRSCQQVPETVYSRQENTTGAGALVGGVAGGLLGNTIGHGSGRTVATIGGAVLGGLVGNRVESNMDQPEPNTVYRTICRTHYAQKSVQTGYDVTYIYNGVQKTIVMQTAPMGDTIPLTLTPAGQ